MKMAIRRGIIVGLGVIFQILLSLTVLLLFGQRIAIVEIIYAILSMLIVLGIIKESKNLSKDLPWIIIIMIFPIAGALLYIVIGNNLHKSKVLKNINRYEKMGNKYLVQDKEIKKEIHEKEYGGLKYLMNYVGYPVTKNNDIKYYPLGELCFKDMLQELKQAKKYIFMEYFIIKKGQMWTDILSILEEKAKQGVDVRLIYDDMGCIASFPSGYPKTLEAKGIKCIAFNNLNPFLGVIMNNRDHRKIMIIDGHTVFSGGINLADEYINITHPYGHWKDNGIRIKGEAVWNFTVMFLNMWNSYRKEDKSYKKYKYSFGEQFKENGYVVPYGESPLDDELVGENVYLNILNQSKKYVYIFTPYLIIDNDMINSLLLAAKRGVDVRIIVPGIPDKKIVYLLTTSYFETLIKNGVKIYTYTPGFIHSKVFVSDDNIVTVGTINMDYRSLYLHFECGVLMQDTYDVIHEVKKDLLDTMKASHQVTEKEATPNVLKGLGQAILRLFAPLM